MASSTSYTWIWVAIFVLIVAIIIIAIVVPPPGVLPTDYSIQILNQSAGINITVSQVQLISPGYVVINSDVNGAVGNILGHSELLSGGVWNNVFIKLNTPATLGEKLYAFLYVDNGNSTFELPGDNQAIDNQGNPVEVSFYITNQTSSQLNFSSG
ncbi:MAG: hypothetical protein WC238_05715 [Parcubacteria group bacterium]|jgi:hypothetical protein